MRKSSYFASRHYDGWPDPSELEGYFLAPRGQEWFFETGNDTGGFTAEGLEGTSHLKAHQGRVDIRFEMWGHPKHGVLLVHKKRGGRQSETYLSKGDLSRLREYVRNLHDDPLPVGLFLPFATAWNAVQEFMRTGGQLPKSIVWIASDQLPPDTFPDP